MNEQINKYVNVLWHLKALASYLVAQIDEKCIHKTTYMIKSEMLTR